MSVDMRMESVGLQIASAIFEKIDISDKTFV